MERVQVDMSSSIATRSVPLRPPIHAFNALAIADEPTLSTFSVLQIFAPLLQNDPFRSNIAAMRTTKHTH